MSFFLQLLEIYTKDAISSCVTPLFLSILTAMSRDIFARNEFPHGVSDPLHIIILKYDYMNDFMYDYMKGVTNSV